MDTLQVIKDRCSVRAFRPDPAPDEHLETMLDAARYAPTAGNRQPWCFLVVRQRANLERLRPKLEQHMRERIEATEAEPTALVERLRAASAYVEGILAAPLVICCDVLARRIRQNQGARRAYRRITEVLPKCRRRGDMVRWVPSIVWRRQPEVCCQFARRGR